MVQHGLLSEYDAEAMQSQAQVANVGFVEQMVLAAPQRFGGPEDRLSLGRFFLIRGVDARKVLDQFYDVALKERPDFVAAYLATAELALDKEDYSLAAETLRIEL